MVEQVITGQVSVYMSMEGGWCEYPNIKGTVYEVTHADIMLQTNTGTHKQNHITVWVRTVISDEPLHDTHLKNRKHTHTLYWDTPDGEKPIHIIPILAQI